jgi:hypothetical protein
MPYSSRRIASVALAAVSLQLLVVAGPASAQPSAEQQSALRNNCRSDFMSNCSGVTPGGAEALQCLQRNVAKLLPLPQRPRLLPPLRLRRRPCRHPRRQPHARAHRRLNNRPRSASFAEPTTWLNAVTSRRRAARPCSVCKANPPNCRRTAAERLRCSARAARLSRHPRERQRRHLHRPHARPPRRRRRPPRHRPGRPPQHRPGRPRSNRRRSASPAKAISCRSAAACSPAARTRCAACNAIPRSSRRTAVTRSQRSAAAARLRPPRLRRRPRRHPLPPPCRRPNSRLRSSEPVSATS